MFFEIGKKVKVAIYQGVEISKEGLSCPVSRYAD